MLFRSIWIFLSKKLENDPDNSGDILKEYLKRLIHPLLIVEFLNVFLNMIKCMITVEVFDWNGWLLDNIKHFFFYPYGAMWYVQASIIGVIIMYPFWKKGRMFTAFIIALILYDFALISNNYWFLVTQTPLENLVRRYTDIFISSRNGVFVGFLYMTIGWFCVKYKDIFRNMKRKIKCIMYILALCCYIFEIFYLWNKPSIDDGALYLTHIIVIPLLVLTFLETKNYKDNTKRVRKLSTEMYFSHRAVLVAVEIILILNDVTYPGYMIFAIVLVVCILLSILKERYFCIYMKMKK
ncbi:MAG: acyltransferase [Lachnospiraceae bacterium]|nr:acyltransferase [Lachnospiraceae bacterium]